MSELSQWVLSSRIFPTETVLAASAIHADHEYGVCAHHPQGCTKDCMCPKLLPPSTGDAEAPAQGHVNQPFLAHCSDEGSVVAPPAFGIFLPTEVLNLRPFDEGCRLVLIDRVMPPRTFSDPPQKVPIS